MTLPATDGILEKLQALLAYDASSPLIFSSGLFLFLFAGFMLIYNAFRRVPMARIVYVILFRSISTTNQAASISCCSSSPPRATS